MSLILFQFVFTARRDASKGFYAPEVLPLPEREGMTAEEHKAALRDAAAIFELNRREELRQQEERETAAKEAERSRRANELFHSLANSEVTAFANCGEMWSTGKTANPIELEE